MSRFLDSLVLSEQGSPPAPASGTLEIYSRNGGVYIRTPNADIGPLGAPTVYTNMVTTDTAQDISGVKTFTMAPLVPDGSFSIGKINGLQSSLDSKYSAANPPPVQPVPSNMVTTDTTQSISGTKTFTTAPGVPDGSWSIAKTTGLQTALDSKYSATNLPSNMVTTDSFQTLTSAKVFSGTSIQFLATGGNYQARISQVANDYFTIDRPAGNWAGMLINGTARAGGTTGVRPHFAVRGQASNTTNDLIQGQLSDGNAPFRVLPDGNVTVDKDNAVLRLHQYRSYTTGLNRWVDIQAADAYGRFSISNGYSAIHLVAAGGTLLSGQNVGDSALDVRATTGQTAPLTRWLSPDPGSTVYSYVDNIGRIYDNGNRVYSASNKVPVSGLSATGTADATTFLRGDNTWATITTGTAANVVTSAATVAHRMTVANSTTPPATPAVGDVWVVPDVASPTGGGAADTSNLVTLNTAQSIAGTKTFTVAPIVPDGSFAISKVINLTAALDARVTLTGDQTIAGIKTFSTAPVVPDASFTTAKVSGLQTTLDATVRLTGAQTIAGVKTFSDAPVVPDSSFTIAKISATGTRDSTTMLRGDGTFGPVAAPPIPFSYAGTVAVKAGVFKFPIAVPCVIESVQITAGTASAGASIIADVNRNGTTVFTTQANRPTLAAGAVIATSATPDVTTLVAGDYLTVDIDQVGTTTAGSDVMVVVRIRRT